MADRTPLGPIRGAAAPAAGLRSGPPTGLPPTADQRPDLKRSGMTDGYGIPLGRVLAGANCHDSPLLAPTLDLDEGSRTEERRDREEHKERYPIHGEQGRAIRSARRTLPLSIAPQVVTLRCPARSRNVHFSASAMGRITPHAERAVRAAPRTAQSETSGEHGMSTNGNGYWGPTGGPGPGPGGQPGPGPGHQPYPGAGHPPYPGGPGVGPYPPQPAPAGRHERAGSCLGSRAARSPPTASMRWCSPSSSGHRGRSCTHRGQRAGSATGR
ncbi:hypothetical protein SANTM175S_04371 [Streptomyces antimycoticus]